VSIEKIHLWRLLKLLYLPAKELRAELLKDIGEERRRGSSRSNGGDFYGPFWSDAKKHIAGAVDLAAETNSRVAANEKRARLYPILKDNFMHWWHQKRRMRNEEVAILQKEVRGRLKIEELNCIIKVENTLAVKVGDQYERVIYPYFSEEPVLSPEACRIAFWILIQTLPDFELSEFRLLDVLRATSYSIADYQLAGNERALLLARYKNILLERKRLSE
jgi:hypothetical protein